MPARHYTCYHVDQPVEITGELDKPIWQAAAWSEPFVDILGPHAPSPRYRTRMKMLWDDDHMYIAAELEEPHVWAAQTERDSVIFLDNDFEVFIDPDGDNHQYYEIEINALNTVWDLLLVKPYRDGGPPVNGWDAAGLKTAVRIDGTLNDPADTDRGWTVEMALPWKALKECAHRACPPADGDFWRINFSRVEWETSVVDSNYVKTPGLPEDNWVWSPQGAIDMHRPESWGYVVFSSQSPSGAEPGPAFIDPAANVKALLMRIYHAQKAFFQEHDRYAGAEELSGLEMPPTGVEPGSLRIETMTGAFCASALAVTPQGAQCWTVREDSRLFTE